MSGIVGSYFNTRGSGVVAKLGTDGQVFTSTGAGLSQGFEAAAGGGAWTFIKSITDADVSSIVMVDGSSGVVFDNTYIAYELWGFNVFGVTNDRTPRIRISTDGGSSYETSNYEGQVMRVQGASVDANSYTDVFAGWDGTGDQTGEKSNFRMTFYNPAQTADFPTMTYQIMWVNHSTTSFYQSGGSVFKTAGAIDAIQLYASSGNISCDYLKLYGLSPS